MSTESRKAAQEEYSEPAHASGSTNANPARPKRRAKDKAENAELQLMEQRLNCQANVKIKLLLVGSSLVGKTSLVSRFASNQASIENLKPTLPGDFHQFILKNIGGINAHVRIWDMGGMEKLHDHDQLADFYNGVQAVMLVFALDNFASFEQLPVWMSRIRRLSACQQCQQQQKQQEPEQKTMQLQGLCQHIDCALVGNKSDQADRRLIASREADEFARHYGMPYVEASAMTVDNVQKAFYDLVLAAVQRRQLEQGEMLPSTGIAGRGRNRRPGGLAGLKALCCSCTVGRDGA